MVPNAFQLIAFQRRLLLSVLIFSLSICAGKTVFAAGTNVPISEELATGIAADLFPVTVKLGEGNLFLTNPVALFLENGRVGLQVRVQATIALPRVSQSVKPGRQLSRAYWDTTWPPGRFYWATPK